MSNSKEDIVLTGEIIALPLKRNIPKRSGSGTVLDFSATVPKAAGLIQIKEKFGALSLQDQKVLACLLYHAADNIAVEGFVHSVPLSELRSFLGEHQSNDQVRQSITKLSEIRVDFDFLGLDDREWGRGTFLSAKGYEVGQEGNIKYAFNLALLDLLEAPAKWARLSLSTLRLFQKKYGARLYENLELYANRRVPEWRVSIEDLRSLLGANDVLKGWGQFNEWALKPALQEVNEFADFETLLEISKKRGRAVAEVTFHIRKKQDRKNREYIAKLCKKRDAGDIVLKPETFEKARRIAPRMDVYLIEQDWRHWIKSKGKSPPKNADGAFLKFAARWYERRKGGLL